MSKNSTIEQVEINIDELKSFVKHMVKNNRFLQETGKMPVAINIIGESGIGKTSSLLQVGKELGLDVVKINLAQIEELSELTGYPVRQFQLAPTGNVPAKPAEVESAPVTRKVMVKETVKKMVNQEVTVMEMQEVDDFEVTVVKKQVLENGKFVSKDIETKTPIKVMKEVPVTKMMDVEVEVEEEVEKEVTVDPKANEVTPVSAEGAVWVDEQAVQEYVKQGYTFTGQKRMSYCAPEWIADKPAGGILLLDDFNRANERFMQAVMELVDRQTYISWKLPKDWHILLSSNPTGADYFVQEQDSAQKTRYISVGLKFDAEVWGKWAESAGIDSRCITFLLMHPELVNKDINARAITNFFNSITTIEDFSKDTSLALIQMIGEGSVGPEFSTMFTTFINNKLDKMISPKEILLNPSEAYVVGALRGCIGKDADYRADIASVMASRIVNFSLHYAENNSITQKEIDRLIRLTTEKDLIGTDLQYHIVKKIINGNKKKFEKMMTNDEVLSMTMK